MPEYLAPGVYVEEVPFRSHPIEGVSTSTAGLVGFLAPEVRRRRFRCGVIVTEPVYRHRCGVARVLAHELRRDLFRVDLAAVISKYIGETEKNLSRLFSRAQKTGAVLFFDEADALFQRRSTVKTAKGRPARFNPSWFLEQLKAFRGVVLLAVRRKETVDPAFLRRFRYLLAKEVLQLNLHREFFAAIAAKEKRVEYRKRKPYWKRRLEGRDYGAIQFRNGYATEAPEMLVEFRGAKKIHKWGAPHYAIELGRILKIQRWKS